MYKDFTISEVIYYKNKPIFGHLLLTEGRIEFYQTDSTSPNVKIMADKSTKATSSKLNPFLYSLSIHIYKCVYIFSNLSDEAIEKIGELFDFSVDNHPLSVNGLTVGETQISDYFFSFNTCEQLNNYLTEKAKGTHNKLDLADFFCSFLTIPFDQIARSAVQNKNELVLELTAPENSSDDILCEAKFYVNEDAANMSDRIALNCENMQIDDHYSSKFLNVLFLNPRNRFDVSFYSEFLFLQGRVNSFKVYYRGIGKIALLSKNEEKKNIVFEISPAIAVGQTYYEYLTLEFDVSEVIDESENESGEEEIKPKRAKLTEEKPTVSCYEKFCTELRNRCNKPILEPTSFEGKKEIGGIRADYKTSSGTLYFLEDHLVFLPKPIIFFKHKEIIKVELLRWNNFMSKTFDVKILAGGKQTEFNNIEREELKEVVNYLVKKGIRIQDVEELQKVSFDSEKIGKRSRGELFQEELNQEEIELLDQEEENDLVDTEGSSVEGAGKINSEAENAEV